MQSPLGSAIDAAAGGVARQGLPSTQPDGTPQFHQETDFMRSMGIRLEGVGVATPSDFNLGGRVTIYGPGAPAAGGGESASTGGNTGTGGDERGGLKSGNADSTRPDGSDKTASTSPRNPAGDVSPAPVAPPGKPDARGSGGGKSVVKDGDDGKKVNRGDPPIAPNSPQRKVSLRDCGGAGNPCAPSPAIDTSIGDRVKPGVERDPGQAAPPTNTRIEGTGIAVPACTEQSREGLSC